MIHLWSIGCQRCRAGVKGDMSFNADLYATMSQASKSLPDVKF